MHCSSTSCQCGPTVTIREHVCTVPRVTSRALHQPAALCWSNTSLPRFLRQHNASLSRARTESRCIAAAGGDASIFDVPRLLERADPVELARPGDLIRVSTQAEKSIWLEVYEVMAGGGLLTSSQGEYLHLDFSASQIRLSHAGWQDGAVPGVTEGCPFIPPMQDGHPAVSLAMQVPTSAAVVYSYSALEQAVSACPAMWVDGYPGQGDSAFTEMESQLMTAGELLALLLGKRNLVLCQLWTPVVNLGRKGTAGPAEVRAGQFVFKPYVLRLLRQLADDNNFRMMSSRIGPAETVIGYRAEAPQPQRARFLQSLGAQAAVVAESAYYKALIGRILGYSEANILHHLRSHGHIPSQEIADLVEKDLREIDAGPLRLPDFTRLPPAGGQAESLLQQGLRKGNKKVAFKPAGFGSKK